MKNVTKIGIVLLALIAGFVFTSCGGGKAVKVVTENAYYPLNFKPADSNEGIGLEYDIINEIGKRLGWNVQWSVLAWDPMITAVHDGQFDIGADGISITEERKKQVDFSDSFLNNQQFLLVRKGETRFKTPAEFKTNTKLLVGAQGGTTGFWVAKDTLLDGNEKNPRIKLYETFGASVQALIAGDIDVVLTDAASGKGYVGANPDKLEVVGDAIGNDELGFIFTPKSELLKPFNEQLKAIKDDGTLDKLITKWFYEYSAKK